VSFFFIVFATLDPAAGTLSYTNISNGDSGTIPYSVNLDGTYALVDPQGVLIAAYEVPNFGMIVQAAKAGPSHDMPALITAVAKGGSISPTTWANQKFNYMQFRTAAGGMEVGSAAMDAQGNVTISHYWPYGNSSGQSAFGGGNFSATDFVPDPSGAFMTMTSGGSSPDYVFGTPGGVFAVDTTNGAIIGLKKASSKNFDATVAGSYKAIYYQKTGAATGQRNVETGTPSLGNAAITIGVDAQITVQDSHGNTLVMELVKMERVGPVVVGIVVMEVVGVDIGVVGVDGLRRGMAVVMNLLKDRRRRDCRREFIIGEALFVCRGDSFT